MAKIRADDHRISVVALSAIGVLVGVLVAAVVHDVILGVIAGSSFIAVTVGLLRLWVGGGRVPHS